MSRMIFKVRKLEPTVIFFNRQIATFDGGEVMRNEMSSDLVMRLENGDRYEMSVQNFVNGVMNNLAGETDILKELADYADSLDNDINTINNFEIACCDARELEVLQNVFDNLEKLIKKYGG